MSFTSTMQISQRHAATRLTKHGGLGLLMAKMYTCKQASILKLVSRQGTDTSYRSAAQMMHYFYTSGTKKA